MSKTLSGIISFNDGMGFTAEDGNVVCNTLYCSTLDIGGTPFDPSVNNFNVIEAQIATINSEISTINTEITGIQLQLSYFSYNTGTATFTITENLKVLGTFNLQINSTLYDVGQFLTNTNSTLSSQQSQITNLLSKTTDITFDLGSSTTTIIGTTNLINANISGSLNSFSNSNWTNAISNTETLTSDCQQQINTINTNVTAIGVTAGTALAGTVADAAAIVIIQGQVTTIEANVAALDGEVTTLQGDVTDLQNKTSQITYSSGTGITSINGTQLNTNTLSSSNINYSGSLVQSNNNHNTFTGISYFQAGVEIQTSGLLIDANSNFTNNGPTIFNGNLTCSSASTLLNSTATQIGTGSASALTINSTTTIPASNLTLQYGSLIGNTISNYNSGSLSINAVANSLQLNSNTINIGVNQGVLANNSINIGAITSASVINLNGIVNSTFPINTTGIFSQF